MFGGLVRAGGDEAKRELKISRYDLLMRAAANRGELALAARLTARAGEGANSSFVPSLL